jgi:hypothetical protein
VLVDVMLAVWRGAASLASEGHVRIALLALTVREARAWAAAQGRTDDRSGEAGPHRAALHLAYCEHLDHDGIAHVLGCAPQTAEELLNRGRRLFAAQLGGDPLDEPALDRRLRASLCAPIHHTPGDFGLDQIWLALDADRREQRRIQRRRRVLRLVVSVKRSILELMAARRAA